MAGRGMRARAPVSYNDKGSTGMVPAWLKTIQPNVTDPPAESKKKKKPSKVKKKTEGSPDKENGSVPSAEEPTVDPSGPSSKGSGSAGIKAQTKKADVGKAKGKKTVAARGRNAGLTVIPIGDGPEPGISAHAPPKPKNTRGGGVKLTKKDIPGLPWAQQYTDEQGLEDDYDSERTPSPEPRHGSLKRKASPTAGTQGMLKDISEKLGDVPESKKRKDVDDPFDISVLMKPLGGLNQSSPGGYMDRRYGGEFNSSPDVYKIQMPEISSKHVQEMRESMASLVDLCKKLEEENAALKDLKIREDIEQVIEIQNEKVREHGKAASEVANHWKSEAERLAELLDKEHVSELNQTIRELKSRISELELEVNDLTISKMEKESRITELQKRNTFLEKYARIYSTADKCVGTDQIHGVDVGVQAPHGVAQLKARSMAPEGAPSSSMYTYGAVDASGPHWGGMHRGHRERTYDLQPQATIPHVRNENRAISSGVTGGSWHKNDVLGTKESRAHLNRRASATPESLIGPDGQPKQIEFYSGSRESVQPSKKLDPVHEHDIRSVAEISLEERELLIQFGLEAEISGPAVVYSHPQTGFMFKICPAEEEEEDDESGPMFDLEYIPLVWGSAQHAIGACETLQDQLLDRMSFMSKSRLFLLKEIGNALKVTEINNK